MRKAFVWGIALLVTSVAVLGGTVFRQQVADASSLMSVFVTNDSSHPVAVREQNLDANGNIKVHEQGTASVNVTNSSLSVETPPVTGGAAILGPFLASPSGGAVPVGETVTATALAIHMTPGVNDVLLYLSSGSSSTVVADLLGPAFGGQSDIVLALTRPIEFNAVFCQGSGGDECGVSTVGAQP